MSPGKNAIRAARLALSFSLILSAHAADSGSALPTTEFAFHAVVPLGVDAFAFGHINRTMYLLASAHDPQFEGWRRVRRGEHRTLLDAAGNRVQFYPADLHFRVTASTRLKLIGVDPWPQSAPRDLNHYMLGLRFQLRIFRGLQQRIVKPGSVAMIGMPAGVPYDERVYHLVFHVGKLPMFDRVVLEVLSPTGERLSRFHLDMD